jgi:hypothetical protein
MTVITLWTPGYPDLGELVDYLVEAWAAVEYGPDAEGDDARRELASARGEYDSAIDGGAR